MTAISREKAREIVDDIRENNGGISPSDRAKTPASVLRSLDSVRRKLGAATQTLATNLYTKDTRFVFELIQNAEDNNYATAEAACDDPCLVFTLLPEKIIIDSNEDGFTEANVRAICSTGESTKSISKGYIGEKGIGFKSVFKVASKVYIQSEPFSFSFEHTFGDGGLGMVTPMFEDHHEIPSKIRTRMTLTLANPAEAENLAKDFYDLPETLLLFLSKLRKIRILRDEAPYPPSEITYSKQDDPMQHRATLTKLSVYNRDGHRLRQRAISTFQIKSRTLKNLPHHRARLHSNQAEVVLAFPLDSQSIPIIQQQHVFAFLPIRQVGFTFQIQCDFITQASREDIERTERNEAILRGVAETFRDAVLDFCSHPTLQFQWMRYLPSQMVYDAFWAQLRPQITRLLKETRVLRPWSGGALRRPDQLKWVPDDFRDELGNPLFKDILDEVYLSPEYEWSDIKLLDSLAVRELSYWDISSRVHADLDESSSRWKSSTSSDDWVTRSASMLTRPFHTQGSTADMAMVKRLPLVPLQDGSWVAGAAGSFLHPDSDGIPVPTDLGLRLVHPQGLKNSARKALFAHFGLQNCVPEDVLRLISKKYNSWSNAPLQSSVLHLRYLYWHLPKEGRNLPKTIYLKDQRSQSVYRTYVTHGREIIVDDLYFETDGIYEPRQLSMQVKSGSEIICPAFPLHFINRAYMDAVPSDVSRCDTSWEDWLSCSAGVQHIPRLVHRSDKNALSDFFAHILKWHQDKLVGTLKTHWASYKKLMTSPVILALCEAAVPCEGDIDNAPLRTTYLPLAKLVKVCKEVEVYRKIPFLKLPVEIDGDTERDWKFLTIFDVGHEANARFYLDVLRHFVQTHQSLNEVSIKSLIRMYEALETYSKADDYEFIRKFFGDENVIHVPARGSQDALWTSSDRCVWKAPQFLVEWHALSDLEGYSGNERLRHLFNVVLDIGDADWTDYLWQLQAYKRDGLACGDVSAIYRCLCSELVGEEDWKCVRERFEEECLVYEPVQKEWHKPSSCLWTDDTRISGKVALLGHYPDLQAFFVKRLRVEEPDIYTYITELRSLVVDKKSSSVKKVKELIKQVNFFNPSTGALDDLKAYSFLPVQGTDATVCLKSSKNLFAILDRSAYSSAFKGKVPILDFDLEEVRELRQTFKALRLEHRYISRLVMESTTVTDSSQDGLLSASVQRRAYALLRCAFHYGSQGLQSGSLYDKLKATNVYQSDGISKKITFTLKDIRIAVEGATGIVHVEEDDRQLRIYVPRKRKERKICYCTELPEKLAALLCLEDVAAVRVLGDVLTKSSSMLDELLEYHGVVQVPGTGPAGQTDSDDSLSEHDTEQHVAHLAPPPLHSPSTPVRNRSITPTLTPASASSSSSRAAPSYTGSVFNPRSSQIYTGYPSTPNTSISPSPSRMMEDPSPEIFNSGHEYRALLDRVIRAASRAPFPRPGVPSPETGSDLDDATTILLSDTVFGRRSDGKVSHDVKIGAAGELFAFEFLLKFLEPQFDQSNWRSTIRKEVCAHEKYRDMPPWNGRETADIMYEDRETANAETTYKLTKLLCKYGYLPNDLLPEHQGASLNYYLEVKTTTLGCGTRLFVSKAQYQRMHEMVLHPGVPVKNIYVILRVFNLGQEDMGMRIYVDPASMERNGELQFQAETYTVVPAVEEEL